MHSLALLPFSMKLFLIPRILDIRDLKPWFNGGVIVDSVVYPLMVEHSQLN